MVKDRSFLSDAALHLFLQSNLSVEKIQAWLDNKMEDSVYDLIQRGKDLVLPDDHASQTEKDSSVETEEDSTLEIDIITPSSQEDS